MNTTSSFDRYKYLLLFCLASLVTIASIRYSLTHYRLINFPGYDDVSYFADSLSLLDAFFNRHFLFDYIHQAPHSFITMVQCFMGYLIFGYHTWAPYATNVVIVFTLLIFSDKWVENLTTSLRIMTALFVCTTPFVVLSVCEFRPDFYWGVFTAYGCLIPIAQSWIYKSKRYQVQWGIIFALALLTKSSASLATVLFFGCAWILALFSSPEEKKQARVWHARISLQRIFLTTFLVTLPYYAFAYQHVASYIYQALISNKDVWGIQLSLSDTLHYYLNGPGGKIEMDKHFFIFTGLLGLSVVTEGISRNKRYFHQTALLLLMLLVLYAIPTKISLKTPFLGSAITCGFLFVGLYALSAILQTVARIDQRLQILLMAGLLVLGMTKFQWPPSQGTQITLRRAYENKLFNSIYQDMKDNLSNEPMTFIASMEGPIVCRSLFNRAQMEGYFNLKMGATGLTKSLSEAESIVNQGDLVLAQEDGTDGATPFLPSYAYQGALLNYLMHNPKFYVIGEYRSFNGKKLVLFRHVSPFQGIKGILGISSQDKNKILGFGYASEFTFQSQFNKPNRLEIEATSLQPKLKNIMIYVDQKLIATVNVKKNQPIIIKKSIALTNQDKHTLLLEYRFAAHHAELTEANPNLIFSKLEVLHV